MSLVLIIITCFHLSTLLRLLYLVYAALYNFYAYLASCHFLLVLAIYFIYQICIAFLLFLPCIIFTIFHLPLFQFLLSTSLCCSLIYNRLFKTCYLVPYTTSRHTPFLLPFTDLVPLFISIYFIIIKKKSFLIYIRQNFLIINISPYSCNILFHTFARNFTASFLIFIQKFTCVRYYWLQSYNLHF